MKTEEASDISEQIVAAQKALYPTIEELKKSGVSTEAILLVLQNESAYLQLVINQRRQSWYHLAAKEEASQ